MGEITTRPDGYYKAEDKSDYIRRLAEAKKKAELSALEAEYKRRVSELSALLDSGKLKFGGEKEEAANRAAIENYNLNESLAKSGLNTGAGGQIRLSRENALKQAIAELYNRANTEQREGEAKRERLKGEYIDAIKTALSKNDALLAEKLFDEAVRIDRSFTALPKSRGGGGGKKQTSALPFGFGLATAAATLGGRRKQLGTAAETLRKYKTIG